MISHLLAAALVCAVVCAGTAAQADIAVQKRTDVVVGSSPSAFALIPGTPPTLLISTAKGLAAFHYEDGVLEAGPRSSEGHGAEVVVSGPLAPGGASAVAYASRETAHVTIAPVDAQGVIGTPDLIDLPALPRAARIGPLRVGGSSALFVAHDAGLSVILRGEEGWQRRELAAPAFATDVAAADLDGNGTIDLVVADESTNRLAILRGLGDGGFEAGPQLATARTPKRVVVADIDGDRRPDLLVLSHDGLVAHLARADGGFAQALPLQAGSHLVDIAAADVTGDGRADLAVLDQSRSTLTLLHGGDSRRFALGDSYLVGYGADAVVLADLDGDGTADAVTLNRLGDSATLLRGLGGGVFDGVVCVRSEIGDLTAVAVEDFNRDGYSDLAVVSENGGRVAIHLGRGDGRFRSLTPLAIGRQPRAVVATDFNQDDNPDLAVVNFGSDAVAILHGDGRGGFAPPRTVSVGTGPSAISVGSFGSDTGADLAIVNSLSNSVSVLYSDGRGEFPTVTTFPVSARPSFLIVGDTNRDGHQDLVVGSEFSESVAVLLGDGRKLDAPTTNQLSATARASLAEDLDQDGHVDLINPEETAGQIEILPGTGPGEFGRAIQVEVGRDPRVVATGDFDRDGRVDLAVVHRATQTIAILLNRSPRKPPPTDGQRAKVPSGPRTKSG